MSIFVRVERVEDAATVAAILVKNGYKVSRSKRKVGRRVENGLLIEEQEIQQEAVE